MVGAIRFSRRVAASGFLAALAIALFPAIARAQLFGASGSRTRPEPVTVPVSHVAPDGFGTASSILSVGFPSFLPSSSNVGWTERIGNALYYYQPASPSADWRARLNLPGGAVVDSIELDACDSTATGSVEFALVSTTAGADLGQFLTPVGNTGLAATPGCGLFALAPFAPVVVNNDSTNYWLTFVFMGDFSSANAVTGIRVHYHLQVSPDPATATFGDVPVGHPQHRFVEALVAAGITAGCGGGNFCPTAPLTRGQMAVFLSVALGLNFPN